MPRHSARVGNKPLVSDCLGSFARWEDVDGLSLSIRLYFTPCPIVGQHVLSPPPFLVGVRRRAWPLHHLQHMFEYSMCLSVGAVRWFVSRWLVLAGADEGKKSRGCGTLAVLKGHVWSIRCHTRHLLETCVGKRGPRLRSCPLRAEGIPSCLQHQRGRARCI